MGSFNKNKWEQRKKQRGDEERMLSARVAEREMAADPTRRNLRQGIHPFMERLCPKGWTYSDEKAKRLTCDKVGYYIDSAIVSVIDPETANDLYLNHNYQKNRSFDQAHSVSLSASMELAPAIAIAISDDGHPVIVNGQHTMWAIYMKNRPVQASVTVYQCRDERAKADLFTIFDSNKKRSLAQAIDAHRHATNSTSDIPAARHARWTQCVAAAENGFNPPKQREMLLQKTTRANRPEIIDFATWIEGIISNANQAKMIHQGVGAAFFAMFLSDRSKATEFVTKYISGLNIDSTNDPVGMIRERMTIKKPKAEHGSSACKMHAGLVYTAWRAFCMGKQLGCLRLTQDLPAPDRWKIYQSANMQEVVMA